MEEEVQKKDNIAKPLRKVVIGQLFQKNAKTEQKAIFRPPLFPRCGVFTYSELRIRVILLALSSGSAGTLSKESERIDRINLF